MNESQWTSAATAVTDLVLDLFRLNNRLLSAGDRLVAELNLTSARWQVLGAIVNSSHPQSVAWLARDLGANRQNVQRIMNDLQNEGLVSFEPNPHHRRSPLVVLTKKGWKTFDAAMRLQAPWMNALSRDLSLKDIKATHNVVKALRQRLESDAASES